MLCSSLCAKVAAAIRQCPKHGPVYLEELAKYKVNNVSIMPVSPMDKDTRNSATLPVQGQSQGYGQIKGHQKKDSEIGREFGPGVVIRPFTSPTTRKPYEVMTGTVSAPSSPGDITRIQREPPQYAYARVVRPLRPITFPNNSIYQTARQIEMRKKTTGNRLAAHRAALFAPSSSEIWVQNEDSNDSTVGTGREPLRDNGYYSREMLSQI